MTPQGYSLSSNYGTIVEEEEDLYVGEAFSIPTIPSKLSADTTAVFETITKRIMGLHYSTPEKSMDSLNQYIQDLHETQQRYNENTQKLIELAQKEKKRVARGRVKKEFENRNSYSYLNPEELDKLIDAVSEILIAYIELGNRTEPSINLLFENIVDELALNLRKTNLDLKRSVANFILMSADLKLDTANLDLEYVLEDLFLEIYDLTNSHFKALNLIKESWLALEKEISRFNHRPNQNQLKLLARNIENHEPLYLLESSICIEHDLSHLSDRHKNKFGERLYSVSAEGRSYSNMSSSQISKVAQHRYQYFVNLRGWEINPVSNDLASFVNDYFRDVIVDNSNGMDLDENDFLDTTLHWETEYRDKKNELIGGKAHARTIVIKNNYPSAIDANSITDYFAILSNLKNSPFDRTQGPSIDLDIRSSEDPMIIEKLKEAGILLNPGEYYPSATEQMATHISEKQRSNELSPVLKGFITELMENRNILLFERLFVDPSAKDDARASLYKLSTLMASIAIYGFNNNYENWLIQCDGEFFALLKSLFGESSIERVAATAQIKKNMEGKYVQDSCNTIILNIREALKHRLSIEKKQKGGDPLNLNLVEMVTEGLNTEIKRELQFELDNQLSNVYPV